MYKKLSRTFKKTFSIIWVEFPWKTVRNTSLGKQQCNSLVKEVFDVFYFRGFDKWKETCCCMSINVCTIEFRVCVKFRHRMTSTQNIALFTEIQLYKYQFPWKNRDPRVRTTNGKTPSLYLLYGLVNNHPGAVVHRWRLFSCGGQ